jgi:hypothetical protein
MSLIRVKKINELIIIAKEDFNGYPRLFSALKPWRIGGGRFGNASDDA